MMQILLYSQASVNKYGLISLPLLHTGGLIDVYFTCPPQLISLGDLFQWDIHNFAHYCQLPSAEVISVYISTHSVSLSIVLHPG